MCVHARQVFNAPLRPRVFTNLNGALLKIKAQISSCDTIHTIVQGVAPLYKAPYTPYTPFIPSIALLTPMAPTYPYSEKKPRSHKQKHPPVDSSTFAGLFQVYEDRLQAEEDEACSMSEVPPIPFSRRLFLTKIRFFFCRMNARYSIRRLLQSNASSATSMG